MDKNSKNLCNKNKIQKDIIALLAISLSMRFWFEWIVWCKIFIRPNIRQQYKYD